MGKNRGLPSEPDPEEEVVEIVEAASVMMALAESMLLEVMEPRLVAALHRVAAKRLEDEAESSTPVLH